MKRIARLIVPLLMLSGASGQAATTPRVGAKPAPGIADYLYGIGSGPAGSLEYAVAGRIAALAALGQEGGPHGESGPRFVPLVEPSGRQALSDLLEQPSTDVAIVPAPLLERAARADPSLRARLRYVAPLHLETVHVVTRSSVGSLAELAGRRVAVDGAEGVGAALFEDLGIATTPVLSTPDDPARAIREGRVDAVVVVGGDPVGALAATPADAGLRILPVPYAPGLERDFVPATLSHADAPGLVPAAGVVTVAAPAVLAVYLRSPRTERAAVLWSLLAGVLTHVDARGGDAAGRALGDVNWAADLPGWTRLEPVTRWLADKRRDAAPRGAAPATTTKP